MMKGLQLLMLRMESEFLEAIRRHVYAQLQDFVQVVLRDPLRKTIRHKRELIRTYVQLHCFISSHVHVRTLVSRCTITCKTCAIYSIVQSASVLTEPSPDFASS